MSEWLSPIKPIFGVPINRQHSLAQGLVSMWNFSEGMGDLVHDSVGMNDGRMIGMAPMSPTSGWVPGPHGAALAFDGSNDYVTVPNNPTMPFVPNFSIGLWVAIAASGANKAIIGAWPRTTTTGAWDIDINDLNVADFLIRADSVNGTYSRVMGAVNIADSLLHHLFMVCVANRITGYVDGKSIGTNADMTAGKTVSNANPLIIGGRAVGNVSASLISSVSIYNRALSAQEINYLYFFPWAIYDSPASAWEYNQQNRNFDHYYRRLMAA
jgi:hypothetical protein